MATSTTRLHRSIHSTRPSGTGDPIARAFSQGKRLMLKAMNLRMALTVEQIGYCDRISESAVHYAERLLLTKPQLVRRAPAIAKELVHEY
jgi:hypothetical protein